MNKFTGDILLEAHQHSILNYEEINKSKLCGCFYCLEIFSYTNINEWIDEVHYKGKTALCPYCGIDSVIGDESKFPISDIEFLTQMQKHYF